MITAKFITKYDSNKNEKEKIIEKYSFGFLEFRKTFNYGYKKVSGYTKLVTIENTVEYNKLGSITNINLEYYDKNKKKIWKNTITD